MWSPEHAGGKVSCGCGMDTRWTGGCMKVMTCSGMAGFAIVNQCLAPIGRSRHCSYDSCKLRDGTSTAGQDGNVQIGGSAGLGLGHFERGGLAF